MATKQASPFGTVKPCQVLDVIRTESIRALVCIVPGELDEGYVCMFRHTEKLPAKKGDEGTLTMSKADSGEPYWKFSPLGT